MSTRRLTTAQAIISFLGQQHGECDGKEQRLFAGCWGIFGHGSVAGIGQALQQVGQQADFPYYLPATSRRWCTPPPRLPKASDRLRTFACTSSIDPGATNMLIATARRRLTASRSGGGPQERKATLARGRLSPRTRG